MTKHRGAYPDVPESADFVMYWWHRAAQEVAAGRTGRAGLITTNSITQTFNRGVVSRAMESGVGVVWAIPTHPWVDEIGSAAVRVAMTVVELKPRSAVRLEVNDNAQVIAELHTARLNSDLSASADVPTAAQEPLLANAGLSSRGFTLVGRGFVLGGDEAERVRERSGDRGVIVRPYMNGRDLTSRSRSVYVIDFGLRDHAQVREHAVLYDLLRDRVKPQRDANKRTAYREYWWRFGEPRVTLRAAVNGLPRYIATPYVSKHRFFLFLGSEVAPDEKVVCVASSGAHMLGVLSSKIHVTWALAAGSRLGVGNDPTYNNSLCFDPFPFPDASEQDRATVADIAERLHAHRAEALSRDEAVTVTGMYNVMDKLRSGEALTPKERKVHELAACGVLRDLHDELDAAVAAAYGWSWPLVEGEILDRLVALHDKRMADERAGLVRWLRPEYQVQRFGGGEAAGQMEALDEEAPADAPEEAATEAWPTAAAEQLGRVKESVTRTPGTADEVTHRFHGARAEIVRRHLDTLLLLAEVHQDQLGRYHARD